MTAKGGLTNGSTGARESDFAWFLPVLFAHPVNRGVRPLRVSVDALISGTKKPKGKSLNTNNERGTEQKKISRFG